MSMNMVASRNRLLDTDYAIEVSDLARSQILSQASSAILAQANQSERNTIMALLQ
jgi:flagellin